MDTYVPCDEDDIWAYEGRDNRGVEKAYITRSFVTCKGKGKGIPVQAWTGSEGSRRLKLQKFQDSRHMTRLSALRTGCLYPPGSIPGINFCSRLSRPQGRSTAGRIMSMKNSYDPIGNRTFWLVPQCFNQLRHLVSPFMSRTPHQIFG